ncbi:hypothetical protein JCM16163A_48570 [Paenibacillus sp. YK5]|uniref:Uncharacterized protein n=1 Tax=Paenibacillus naphthalenovorans TaxID=162209 RepID=A0A0U2M9D7_9BACL|nr:hypothetical protein IJ22_48260 [Paenibacillus naphthalenovorans]GCL74808.1 hypothetical protein PN4B1_47900 [Paenibacillus naphthalenovorans]SDI36280.1 hypothetical protein SAMN05421868_105222 [Paenibacillus naphthalenovorans]
MDRSTLWRSLAFISIGIMLLIDIIGVIYIVMNNDQVIKGTVYIIIWTSIIIFWLFRLRSWIREGRF